jgi:predicted nucleotidyltransferase
MVMLTAELEADPTLAEIVRRLIAAIDPDRIILFGSRARGDASPDSDYDLLIVKDTAERTLLLAQKGYRALLGLPGPVDLIVETPERIANLRDCPWVIHHDAVREGRILYERSAAG